MLEKIRQSIGGLWRAIDLRGVERRRLAEQIRQLKAKSKAADARCKQQRDALKRVSARRHRRIPSPAVVESLLPLRAGTIAARARRIDARELDRRLEQTSAAYRDALAHLNDAHPELVRTAIQGLPWWVPVPASLSASARDRFVAKQRFPYRTLTQTRELAQGPVLIDVGANSGRMSIPRVILGDFERAYCAEPDALNYDALVRNVVDNDLRGLVLPDRLAISDVRGSARLQPGKYSGGHRLIGSSHSSSAVEVPCRTLDQWCRDLGIDLDLVTYVKVDTQGWEGHVLRGASELLARRSIAWQIEVTPAWLEAAGTPARDLYGLCAERFTHFIDLARDAEGPRVRATAELGEALSYLREETAHTDILLFNAVGGRLARDPDDDD